MNFLSISDKKFENMVLIGLPGSIATMWCALKRQVYLVFLFVAALVAAVPAHPTVSQMCQVAYVFKMGHLERMACLHPRNEWLSQAEF